MAKKNPDINYFRYRYNYFYKRGDFSKAKKVSERADALFGRDIEHEYHAKMESKRSPKDPFGIGRTKKLRYG